MIKQTAITGGLVLSLLLSGCSDELEETPDITEAIPVDSSAEDAVAEGGVVGASASGQDGAASNPAGSTSGASNTARSTARPSTMESGSNASNTGVQLEGSKLQRADPTD